MPRSAEALPITRILPARRSIICGRTARTSRGRGCTRVAKTCSHSVSETSTAGVAGAGSARLATRISTMPTVSMRAAGASGASREPLSAITAAPCSANTAQRTGPMKASAWVISTRLPARFWLGMMAPRLRLSVEEQRSAALLVWRGRRFVGGLGLGGTRLESENHPGPDRVVAAFVDDDGGHRRLLLPSPDIRRDFTINSKTNKFTCELILWRSL